MKTRKDFIKISHNCYIIGKGDYKKVEAMALKADLKKLEDCMIKKHGVITITKDGISMNDFETDAETEMKAVKEIVVFGIEKLQQSLAIAKAQEAEVFETLVQ